MEGGRRDELEVEDSGAVTLQKPEKKLTLKELVDGINPGECTR